MNLVILLTLTVTRGLLIQLASPKDLWNLSHISGLLGILFHSTHLTQSWDQLQRLLMGTEYPFQMVYDEACGFGIDSERLAEILWATNPWTHTQLLNGDCLHNSRLLIDLDTIYQLGTSPLRVSHDLPRMTGPAFAEIIDGIIMTGFNPATSCEWLLSLDMDTVLQVIPARKLVHLVHPECFRNRASEDAFNASPGTVYKLADTLMKSFMFTAALPDQLPSYLRWTVLVCQIAIQLKKQFSDDTTILRRLKQRLSQIHEEISTYTNTSDLNEEQREHVESAKGIFQGTKHFLEWGLLSTSQFAALPSFDRVYLLTQGGLDPSACAQMGERSRTNHWKILTLQFYRNFSMATFKKPQVGSELAKVMQDHKAIWPLDLIWLMRIHIDNIQKPRKSTSPIESILGVNAELQMFFMEEAHRASSSLKQLNEIPDEAINLLFHIPLQKRIHFARIQAIKDRTTLSVIQNGLAAIAKNPNFNPASRPLSITVTISIYFEAIRKCSFFTLMTNPDGTVKLHLDKVLNIKVLGFMLAVCIIFNVRPPFLIEEQQVALLLGYLNRKLIFNVFPELSPSPEVHRRQLAVDRAESKIDNVVQRFQQTLKTHFMFSWQDLRPLLGYKN